MTTGAEYWWLFGTFYSWLDLVVQQRPARVQLVVVSVLQRSSMRLLAFLTDSLTTTDKNRQRYPARPCESLTVSGL